MDYFEKEADSSQVPYYVSGLTSDTWLKDLEKGIAIQPKENVNLVLRLMQEDDIPDVYKIEKLSFAFPWSFSGFLNELENRYYNLSIVASLDSRIAGYIISYRVYDEMHICNVAVDPEFRRRMIGESMLWIILQLSHLLNCNLVHLEVRKSNIPAITLYEKYGFKIVGIRKNYYQEEKEDALLMSLTLKRETY